MKLSFLIPLLLLSTLSLKSQEEILGKWKTIDENTGKARAVVEIYRNGDIYAGQIIKTFPGPGEDADPICDKCQGEDNDKKIIGLEIIKDLVYYDEEWGDGTILDAEHGKTYNCKLWIEDGDLKVRGNVAFFFRTQTWERYEG